MKENKYFYTVLFLDDYYKQGNNSNNQIEKPVLKQFEITNEEEYSSARNWVWSSEDDSTKVLTVTHRLKYPLTVEMWNDEGKPIFYCPVLKQGIDSVSLGQPIEVEADSDKTFKLIFTDGAQIPEDGETFKLSVKTLPALDTTSERLAVDNLNKSLNEVIGTQKWGLAVVFKRNSLDSYFDLIAEFDDSYIHSLSDSSTVTYITNLSNVSAKWVTKYTDNIQDILDEINTERYEIKFSWKTNTSWEDPFGYQTQQGHLNN